MLKYNRKQCKKLYKYYNKEFSSIGKNLAKHTPNFLHSLDLFMLYLQFFQDNILLTKEIVNTDDEKLRAQLLSVTNALNNYSAYKTALIKYNDTFKDTSLKDEYKKDTLDKIAAEVATAWAQLWQTIMLTMESWISNEHFMK